MNDLCVELGYNSINHVGEELCGDHVETAGQGEDSQVLVLADGLGSGVKANILSILTSRIISTMIAEGLPLEECVKAIAATLPICSSRGVAYSTFTILRLINNELAEIICYDNPPVILIRDGAPTELPGRDMIVGGKQVHRSELRLQEGDILVAVSDGCPHAGIGVAYNFGWQLRDIADFVATASVAGYNAKTLSTMLIAECDRLYGGKPGDDATACVVRVRRREPVNIAFGPPRSREDDAKMMTLFFSKGGKHLICGGTTAAIASQYLGTPITTELKYSGGDVPPIGHKDGVDLVTEGIITVSRVIDYAKDMLEQNERHEEWDCGHDGASLISRMLFEEATDINFFVGRAVNPAHQDPNLPISFHIKMKLVEELSELLREMGKRVKVMYF